MLERGRGCKTVKSENRVPINAKENFLQKRVSYDSSLVSNTQEFGQSEWNVDHPDFFAIWEQ